MRNGWAAGRRGHRAWGRLLLLVGAGLLLALPTAASGARGWSAPRSASGPGEVAYGPRLAVSAKGPALLASGSQARRGDLRRARCRPPLAPRALESPGGSLRSHAGPGPAYRRRLTGRRRGGGLGRRRPGRPGPRAPGPGRALGRPGGPLGAGCRRNQRGNGRRRRRHGGLVRLTRGRGDHPPGPHAELERRSGNRPRGPHRTRGRGHQRRRRRRFELGHDAAAGGPAGLRRGLDPPAAAAALDPPRRLRGSGRLGGAGARPERALEGERGPGPSPEAVFDGSGAWGRAQVVSATARAGQRALIALDRRGTATMAWTALPHNRALARDRRADGRLGRRRP